MQGPARATHSQSCDLDVQPTSEEKVTLAQVKPHLQSLLKSAGIYDWTKISWLYDAYWYFADRTVIDDRRREIEFYRNLLQGFRKGDLIFDVGANHGAKTDIFLRLGARVVAVEPDEKSLEILRQRFVNYRLRKMPLCIIGKALSDRDSVENMWIDAPGSAMNTLNRKWADALRTDAKRFGRKIRFDHCKAVQTISMEQLTEMHGLPFFVKIDVEGHEPTVLRGMKRPVPYLSFEVNLPEFRSEGLECVQILEQLAREGDFNYTSECQSGFALKHWWPADHFSPLLNSCAETSIEVFWRSSPNKGERLSRSRLDG